MREQRNLSIDLMKFLYSLVIMFYHFYSDRSHFISGRYAVEFFLVVAGVFFFMAYERDESSPPHKCMPNKYIYKRFMRFLPWSTTAFVSAFVIRRMVISPHTLKQLLNYLSGDIWEVLLVKMNGINNGKHLLNVPVWTLSAMFLVEIVMLGCLVCNKKVFVNIAIPVSMIVGFGFWRNADKIDLVLWKGFTTFGVIRAWLSYCCAYYCLRMSEYLGNVRFNRAGKTLLTAVEIMCHVFALLAIMYVDTRYWHWCVLLAFVIAIAIALSGHSLLNRLLGHSNGLAGAVKFLGAFSFSIYLMHYPIISYFGSIYPEIETRYTHVGQFIVVAAVCSLAHYLVTTGMIRAWRVYGPKIKRAFVEAA